MDNLLFSIFQQLNHSDYLQNSTIQKNLNISRATVLSGIDCLRNKYNISIIAHELIGYRLASPIILLNKKFLQSALDKYQVKINYFVSVRSTNEYLHTINDTTDHIVLAEHQYLGYGRFFRQWFSPFGENVYFSLKTFLSKNSNKLQGLGLCVATSVAQVLKIYVKNKTDIKIKWPNDVYIDGKKISGNLVHINSENNNQSHLIIGIGINVNMLNAPLLKFPWTSLQKTVGYYIDRNYIILHLFRCLSKNLKIFEKFGMSAFRNFCYEHDYLINKSVTIKRFKNVISHGIAQGIDENGCLLILQPGLQKIQRFCEGSVSLNVQDRLIS